MLLGNEAEVKVGNISACASTAHTRLLCSGFFPSQGTGGLHGENEDDDEDVNEEDDGSEDQVFKQVLCTATSWKLTFFSTL